jgi:hypothetical protein
MLFHHFERFVAEYEERFEKAYGYFRPIIKDVVEKYFDCWGALVPGNLPVQFII